MPTLFQKVPDKFCGLLRTGWHDVEIPGLGDHDWAELWFDLGLGFIRYHSVPLEITVERSAGARIRLHRRPRAIAVRFGCQSHIGEPAAELVLQVRKVSLARVLWRWVANSIGRSRQVANVPPFPWSNLQISPWGSMGFKGPNRGRQSKNPAKGDSRVDKGEVAHSSGFAPLIDSSPHASDLDRTCFGVAKINTHLGADIAAHLSLLKVHSTLELNNLAQLDSEAWLVIVNPGHRLTSEGLPQLIAHIEADPMAVAYFGDARPTDDQFSRGFFGLRGQFCPHRLLSGETLGPAMAFKASAVLAVGGWHREDGGAALFCMSLRLFEAHGIAGFRHIPVTLSESVRSGAEHAGDSELCTQSLARLGLPLAAYHTVENQPSIAGGSLTVIIPTRDRIDLLKSTLRSIPDQVSGLEVEVVVIDNGSTDLDSLEWLAQAEQNSSRLRVLRDARDFNFSALCNLGARHAQGDVLAFLNNDVEIASADLLPVCAEMARHAGVGAVGPLLVYPDGRIQHAGILTGPGGVAGHPLAGQMPDIGASDVFPMRTRSVSALTAACLFVAREKFHSVGGFDENLAVAFNDVDLCLKLEQSGLNNVLIPKLEAIHIESQTRKPDRHYDQEPRLRAEFDLMRARWGERLDWDPWVSGAIRVDKGRPWPFWERHPSGRGIS